MASKVYYPALFIGKSADKLRAQLSRNQIPIINLESKEQFTDVVAYYSGIAKLDRVLVLSDMSFLPSGVNLESFLKFIEESPLQIILLAQVDNVIPTILSRVKTINKQSTVNINPRWEKMSTYEVEQDNDKFTVLQSKISHNPDLVKLDMVTKKYKDKIRRLYP